MHESLVVDTVKDRLGRHDGLAAAWLFGSRARGDAGPRSDVDVAILLADCLEPSTHDLLAIAELQADLEEELQCDVDVVVANGAPPDLLFRVLRDGVLLVDAHHGERIEFEVAARNAYWDLLPILDRYRRTLLRGA